jgi:galactokinase
MTVDANALRRTFTAEFGRQPRLWSAPGRVNLIGEHTDYNDGFVLPMAIDRRTLVAGSARADRRVRVRSLSFNGTVEFDLEQPTERRAGYWLNYIEGVARVLETRGYRLRGADLALTSDVPVGAGLSSSAALEVSTGLALLSLAGAAVDGRQLALAGQEAEHVYVGAQVGIMDQLVSALARRGHALLIDCRTLATDAIPFDTTDVAVVVCDTNVKHDLASSEYNVRRAECERGVELLRTVLPQIKALRDVSVAEFAQHEDLLPEPIKRRCRHVVTENARTLAAAAALRAGDRAGLGRLMAASHLSLRDDYEVSCTELDLLVELAAGFNGVLGARMTGGGFGGCTVNLVRRAAVDDFQAFITREYQRTTSIEPTLYQVEAADGAREEIV